MKQKNKIDIIRHNVSNGGGIDKIEKQHKQGKLTARERLALLFDKGTFLEYNYLKSDVGNTEQAINGDGVITGIGLVNGRKICAYIQDFTVGGGTVGSSNAKKISDIQRKALELKIPIIALLDSGGAKIQDGVSALSGYGEIFKYNVMSSGVIPQIAVIMGPCAGGASYSPALCDLVLMVENTSHMFITGPDVVEAVTGEKVDKETLGGARMHMQQSGVAHFKFKDDRECLMGLKKILNYLPDNSNQKVDVKKYRYNSQLDIAALVPENKRNVYNMKKLIEAIFDENSLIEVQEDYAPNILTYLGTMKGISVGIVANQPTYLAGSLDINSCDKASRFINLCSLFNLPIVTFVDVPGYLPGKDQEKNGIIRHGAKMLYAYGKSEVPKMTLILRKAYGGAYLGMCSKEMGADYVVAWENAEIAVMGAEGATRILNRNNGMDAQAYNEYIQEKTKEYADRFLNPIYSAKLGYVDNVIKPEETREAIHAFLMLNKDREITQTINGNFPV